MPPVSNTRSCRLPTFCLQYSSVRVLSWWNTHFNAYKNTAPGSFCSITQLPSNQSCFWRVGGSVLYVWKGQIYEMYRAECSRIKGVRLIFRNTVAAAQLRANMQVLARCVDDPVFDSLLSVLCLDCRRCFLPLCACLCVWVCVEGGRECAGWFSSVVCWSPRYIRPGHPCDCYRSCQRTKMKVWSRRQQPPHAVFTTLSCTKTTLVYIYIFFFFLNNTFLKS